MLKFLKYKISVILTDIRGELEISHKREFTREEQIAFDRFIECLADLFVKYSPLLDEISTTLPAKETA